MAATDTAITEQIRFARAVRSFHQRTSCISARVKHAPPPIDQMTVTQFILPNIGAWDYQDFADSREVLT
ncbi:MAG: hypothetical protein DMF21_00140 [Verrucomicrobia bacterium]|nr:MAG: hypothetical protein DMF21_00140 [Verrucomicrobiota bacterium]